MVANYKDIQRRWNEWPEKTKLRWTGYINLLANLSDLIQDTSIRYEDEVSRQAWSARKMLEQDFERIFSNGRFRDDPGRGPTSVAKMIEMERFSASRSPPVYEALQEYLKTTDIHRAPATFRKPTLEALMHAQSLKRVPVWKGVAQERRDFYFREDSDRFPRANRDWPKWVREEWEEFQFVVFHLESFAGNRRPPTRIGRNDAISENRDKAAELADYLRQRGGYRLDSHTRFPRGGPGAKSEDIQAEARTLTFRSGPIPGYNASIRELGDTLRDYYSFMSDSARERRQRSR